MECDVIDHICACDTRKYISERRNTKPEGVDHLKTPLQFVVTKEI
jgi:hypothetical protein